MSAVGAIGLLIPGPKMIWHFGERGMENSLFTCGDGSVQSNDGCKLATKPQPQWENSWLTNVQRKKIFDDWSLMNQLKRDYTVFSGNSEINSLTTNNLIKRLYISDDNVNDQLSSVVILTNFDVKSYNVPGGFPALGTWYDLMNNNVTLEVTSKDQTISIGPGEFKVLGNGKVSLGFNQTKLLSLELQKNPVNDLIQISLPDNSEYAFDIYSTSGQLINNGIYNSGRILSIKAPTQSGIYYIVIRRKNDNRFGLCKVQVVN
jgi:hypothetical protein